VWKLIDFLLKTRLFQENMIPSVAFGYRGDPVFCDEFDFFLIAG